MSMGQNQQEKAMKKYRVKINWGSQDDQVKTYEFDTEKEMDAFLYGVDEGNGWLSYDIAMYPA